MVAPLYGSNMFVTMPDDKRQNRSLALDGDSGIGKVNSNLHSTRDRVGKVQVPRCGTSPGNGSE